MPPRRPPTVPDDATYRKNGHCWVQTTARGKNRTGVERRWDLAGKAIAEEGYQDGVLHGPKTTWDQGLLLERATYDRGEATGPFQRRVSDQKYTIPAVFERGVQRQGQVFGDLELLDAQEQPIRVVHLGIEPSPETIEELLLSDDPAGSIPKLESNKDMTGALLASALAGGRDLGKRLNALQPPVCQDEVLEHTSMTMALGELEGDPGEVIAVLLQGLQRGGHPGELLRRIGQVLTTMKMVDSTPFMGASVNLPPM